VDKETQEHSDWLTKVRDSGYLGILQSGQLCDRREHPEAIPVQENSFFKTPKPKEVNNG